eukprot:6181072-Pleurochrysis_carterae.AAC.2
MDWPIVTLLAPLLLHQAGASDPVSESLRGARLPSCGVGKITVMSELTSNPKFSIPQNGCTLILLNATILEMAGMLETQCGKSTILKNKRARMATFINEENGLFGSQWSHEYRTAAAVRLVTLYTQSKASAQCRRGSCTLRCPCGNVSCTCARL